MTQYELPDGFQGMETVPMSGGYYIFIKEDGWPKVIHYSLVDKRDGYVGWAPIVPLKRRVMFVVKPYIDPEGVAMYRVHTTPPCLGGWIAERIPTESAAQRIADIYNEVMP